MPARDYPEHRVLFFFYEPLAIAFEICFFLIRGSLEEPGVKTVELGIAVLR